MKMEVACGRWVFTGTLPMELARKSWGDRYAAVKAANAAGYDVMANGACREIEKECRSCLGHGQLADGDTGRLRKCLDCNGTGQI